MERKLAVVASLAVLVVLASWGLVTGLPDVRIVPMGGHDGASCEATFTPTATSGPIDCAFTLTPLFAGILGLMLAVGVIGSIAALRRDARLLRTGALVATLATALVLVEGWLGRTTGDGTLSDRRVFAHAGVLAFAAVIFWTLGRTRGFMRADPARADS